MAVRSGAGHDVAFHVAARPERGQQTAVDARDGRLEVALENAVELNALAGGEAQRAVRVLASKIVQRQILVRQDAAAGNLASDHEHVVLAQSLGPARLAGVAVLLLIGAVELEQALVLVVEFGSVLLQFLGDVAAQARLFSLTTSVPDRLGAQAGRGRGLVDSGGVNGHETSCEQRGKANHYQVYQIAMDGKDEDGRASGANALYKSRTISGGISAPEIA